METTPAAIDDLIESVGPLAEAPEVQLLIELVRKQQQQIEQLKDEPSQAEKPEFA